MQAVSLYKCTRCLAQSLRLHVSVRPLTTKRHKKADSAWPRLAVDRSLDLPKDPEYLVRSLHEKERNSFREALNARDFTGAYQIYEEQRGLPILSAAEVTSLVQLIAADALLRRQNDYEFPESIEQVFWTIIEDVKEGKVAGQTMLWAHALDILVTWDKLEKAQKLWSFLQALPNRVSVDKKDALCIDSRVYGSAIKLYTALNQFSKVEVLYKEALDGRGLMPSLMLDQAYIAALFQARRIGQAYKAMDKTIREQRRVLRPGFFNSMISLALDANAIGVATEIFMKACKINMPPSNTIVTRLLSGLARTRDSPLKAVMTLFKHYRAICNGKIPVEHINCVIDAMFASIYDDVPKAEILSRVHQLLEVMKESGLQSTTSTINILLKGYTSLEEYALVDELMSRAQLNENSFRAILKALAQSKSATAFARVQACWQSFSSFQQSIARQMSSRDLQMLMRAAFATDATSAGNWATQIVADEAAHLKLDTQALLQDELQCHLDGTFVYTAQRGQRRSDAA